MKNKMNDLNDHLFAQLERLSDENLDEKGLEREVQRTSSIVNVSEQIINNAQVALNAAELVAKHGRGNWENMLPNVDGKPKPPVIPDFSDKGGK
ncbi:MAG: hypothetical protein K8U57_27495 [Planctomycetes bacterium]|nr:hypothetical protein [Planctomycetota bacterium]